jgi:hypothetical protein
MPLLFWLLMAALVPLDIWLGLSPPPEPVVVY